MTGNGGAAKAAYATKKEATKKDPSEAPLTCLDSVEALIAKYRGKPDEIRAGIYAAIMTSVGVTSALSMIPLQSNFASYFAGQVLRDLTNPGIYAAINAPIIDYLDNIFPTKEISVFMLLRGMERGALTDEDIIDTAIDSGIKDKEIRKLIKIGKVLRYDRETDDDYALLTRYQNALITQQIDLARLEVDDAITDLQAQLKEAEKLAAAPARKEAA